MSMDKMGSGPQEGSKEYWYKKYGGGNMSRLLAETVLEHAPKLGMNLSVPDVGTRQTLLDAADKILAEHQGKLNKSQENELFVLTDLTRSPKPYEKPKEE